MSPFLIWTRVCHLRLSYQGPSQGPVCNSETKESGDQVALLNDSHPICMVFGHIKAKSLGSQQTR